MDAFKVENFTHDYPDHQFPWFEALSATETKKIRETLLQQVGLSETDNPLTLVHQILKRSQPIDYISADNEAFKLADLFATLRLQPLDNILVNWYRFDDIDRMKREDVLTYFHALWYPGAEDIDIFDDSLSWIVLVLHSGSLRVVYF